MYFSGSISSLSRRFDPERQLGNPKKLCRLGRWNRSTIFRPRRPRFTRDVIGAGLRARAHLFDRGFWRIWMIRVDGRLAFSGGFYKIGNCESKLCPKNCVSYTYLIPKSLPKIPILLNKDSPTWALPDSRIKDLFKVEWRYFLAQHFDLMLGAKIWGIFAFLQQRRVRLCAFDVLEREGRGEGRNEG